MRDIQTITLQELLPSSIASDPTVMAMAKAIDKELQRTTNFIPNVAIIHMLRNNLIEDSGLIDLLAWQFLAPYYDPNLPLETKRELVARALEWNSKKGTPDIVKEVIQVVFADATVDEWYEYESLPYRFRATTEYPITSAQDIDRLIEVIFSVKNTRSWLEYIQSLTRAFMNIYIGIGKISKGSTQIGLRDALDTADRPIVATGYAGIMIMPTAKVSVSMSFDD
jgi:phage tail P2-like protein